MGKNEKTPITIDEVEYFYEDMNRKIGSAQFNLDQLLVGKQAFVNLLKEALTAKVEEVVQ